MRVLLRSATLACSAILLTGCNFRGQNEEAEARVAQFHQLYNGEKVDGLFDLTAPEFRRTTDSESFAGLIGSLQEQLGDAELSEIKDWKVDYFPERRITLTYQTEFERGKAAEMFTFDYGEPPRLINYNATVSAIRPE